MKVVNDTSTDDPAGLDPLWGWIVDHRISDFLRNTRFGPAYRDGCCQLLPTRRLQPPTVPDDPADDEHHQFHIRHHGQHHHHHQLRPK